MQRILVGSLVLFSLLFMISCETSNNPVAPESGASDASLGKGKGGGGADATASGETAYACNADGEFVGFNETNNPDYAIYEYTLWAGKHGDAGTVSITNDDENIYVTYNTNETADLGEVHVYVWNDLSEIPTKRPAPGHADYVVEDINADEYTVVIPANIVCGDTYYISTHAALVGNETEDGSGGTGDNSGETAYAGGADSPACFDGTKGAWWGFVNYTVECFYDISGTVYEDADNSSDLEAGEAGFGGITMTLLDADGNVVATTTTNADGSYLFEHVPGGADYTVISGTPDGDYLANENAGGYSISNLSSDVTDVDFGFVPLYDLSVLVSIDGNMDCFDYSTIMINGVEVSSLENLLPGFEYEVVVTAYDLDGNVLDSQVVNGVLSDDTELSLSLSGWSCSVDPPSSDDNFPTWGQDISHVVLAFTAESAPNGDSDYYLIKIDEYPDAGNDDLDDDIDSYLAQLVSMGLLNSSYELIGSSIKGGRQVTSFFNYGSYNSNGETADAPPAGFPLTYTGGADNEGNQNLIDVTVDWSAFQ